MARRFHRQRSAHAIADLNVTNLIDLGFILLVIFMIATPLMQNEQTLPLDLPKVTAIPQTKADKDDKFVMVGVDASGRFYVENKSAPVTLAELQSRLRAYAQEPKPPVIRVRGDMKVMYQKVAELMAEVQKSGLTRVTFDWETDK
jgi:biopolymer transport protein TolR